MVRTNSKQKILDAAIKLFRERGYSATATSEIAKEAGVAEGTVFKYFNTKKELLLGVLGEFSKFAGEELIEKRLQQVIKENEKKDVRELLREIIKDRMEMMGEYKEVIQIILTEMQFQPEIRQHFLTNILPRIKNVVILLMESGIKRGTIREVNIDLAMEVIGGTIVGHLFKGQLSKSMGLIKTKEQEEKEIDELVDLILYGISK